MHRDVDTMKTIARARLLQLKLDIEFIVPSAAKFNNASPAGLDYHKRMSESCAHRMNKILDVLNDN